MKIIRKHIIWGAALTIFSSILFFPYGIIASPISTDTIISSSWEQGWSWTSPQPFDVSAMEMFILNEAGDPVDFEMAADVGTWLGGGLPWVADFGWTSTLISPDYIYASGPAISSPDTPAFYNYYTGDFQNQYFLLDVLIYDENNLFVETWRYENDYAIQTFVDRINIEPDDPIYDRTPGTPVPEPSTLLLFGTGLIGIGVFRRKFKV